MKRTHLSTWRMIFQYFNCVLHILNIFIIVIIDCPIFNGMINYKYNVCYDKGKCCTILWASGNYCGWLDLVIPLLALKLKCTTVSAHHLDNIDYLRAL